MRADEQPVASRRYRTIVADPPWSAKSLTRFCMPTPTEPTAAQTRMIRVLTLPDRQDKFLVRMGDRVAMDVPCGRVTLELSGGWSESGIGYCHLTYEPIRQGLTRFARHG